jgi:hypothetical protein
VVFDGGGIISFRFSEQGVKMVSFIEVKIRVRLGESKIITLLRKRFSLYFRTFVKVKAKLLMFSKPDHLDFNIRAFAFLHWLVLPMVKISMDADQRIGNFLPTSMTNWIMTSLLKMMIRLNSKLEMILMELQATEPDYEKIDRLLSKIKPLRTMLEKKMLDVPRITLMKSPLGKEILRNVDLTIRVMNKLEQLKELNKPKLPLQIPVFNSPLPFDMKDTFRRADLYK